MRLNNTVKWCAVTIGAMALAVSASIISARGAKRVDNTALRDAGSDGADWITHGHDYAETYYSPLKQIDQSNVSRLGLAWSFDTNDDFGTVEATPIVSNGTMYVTASWGVLFALDARTGDLKWSWDPHIVHHNFPPNTQNDADRTRTGPSVCCGPANRGVAIYDNKIYIGTLTGHLVALDAETGKVVWDTLTIPPNSDYSITGAPRIVKGMVVIGNAGGEYAIRGYVSAYDAETGKQIWRFYTVPGDPSKPFENKAMAMAAKTWHGDWYKLGGGATVWDGITYDPELNLIYIGTSQGGPWVKHYRDPKNGDNLFICSIVALHADTGEYAWHFQTTPDDEWDYDAVQGITLADIKIDGKVRKVLMQAPKNGYFYVLDRKTGKFISGAALGKVTWSKGLDPKTGRPIINPDAYYDQHPVDVSPGPGGEHVWQAMSYNPNTGLVYIPGQDSTFHYVSASTFTPKLGEYNWGIVFAMPAPPPRPANGAAPPPPALTLPGGYLVAWDPVTETARWRVPKLNGGGTFTTATNLVFAASSTGDFEAVSGEDGKELWKVKLKPGFANPVTYEVDGKQYVAVLAGRNGKARVYSFALDANQPIPGAAPEESRNAAPDQPHQPTRQ